MRQPTPKPDYQHIARLEHELGLADPPHQKHEPPIKPSPVCLVKHCDAETIEVRTWSGHLLRRIHGHEEQRCPPT